MKLIDKDALVAKIENISDYVDEHWDTDYAIGAKRFADKLQDAIDTLEVKEVDLEKEIDRVWDNTSDNFSENGWKEFEDIAKHFFELGLQARTDKELVEEVYSHSTERRINMNRIVKVDEFHYGECELDVERVIALVPKKRMLLFERAYWELKQEDYDRVSEVWHKLKSKEL